jgi:hypothetical protein
MIQNHNIGQMWSQYNNFNIETTYDPYYNKHMKILHQALHQT